ncbi:hypothetical protein [Bogoriella caseilytica]|uniref:Yip1 domain-containing protein n=1 Tax=Bogoriella caseilytica TaxID=56055 RepID=A0A3N2BF66_9MICO|nr:hypothetical protein [Bogoriella caseilytica]ROR73892.1 hypothetical protein EDD31_2285 [Bogoriella caseilytica]
MTDHPSHPPAGDDAAAGPVPHPPVHPEHPGPEQPYSPDQQPVYEQPAPQQPGYPPQQHPYPGAPGSQTQQPGYPPQQHPYPGAPGSQTQQPGYPPPQHPYPGAPGSQASAGQHYGPVPEQPAAPRKPSAFAAFALVPLTVLKRIWSGDTGAALTYPGELGQKLGKAHGPWLTVGGTVVVLAMITGLFGTLVSDISMRVSSPFGVSAMTYVTSMVLVPFLAGASFVLRVFTIRWTLGVRQVADASLAEAGNLMAAAGSLYVAFWAVLVPLSLLPGPVGGFLVSLGSAAVGFVAILGAELIIYVGIARRVESPKGPLVPHVLLSLAHAAMVFLLVAIILSISFEAMFYSGFLPFFRF